MPVGSLKHSTHTRVLEAFTNHPTRNTQVRESVELLHYGKLVCRIGYTADGHVSDIAIDTHDKASLSTRAKINALLKRYLPFTATLNTVRGKLILTHYRDGTATMATFEHAYHFSAYR